MGQGILDALRDDPDDRLNHLVYADWLDEHGQARRAVYIRQWWRAQALPRRNRDAVQAALIKQHEADAREWLGPAPEGHKPPTFAGAVLDRIHSWMSPPWDALGAVLQRHAVREVSLWQPPGRADLARLPSLRLIRELAVQGHECDDFFLWSDLPPLRRLTFNGSLDNDTARLLAATARLRPLRSLSGRGNDIDDGGVMALLKSSHLTGLEAWGLTGQRITGWSLLHLFLGGRAKKWRSLTYDAERTDISQVSAIGRCENLQRLWLMMPFHLPDQNPLGFLDALLRLRDLSLVDVSRLTVERLAAWPGLRRLERLSLRGNLGPDEWRPVLDSPHRNPDTVLDIPGVPP